MTGGATTEELSHLLELVAAPAGRAARLKPDNTIVTWGDLDDARAWATAQLPYAIQVADHVIAVDDDHNAAGFDLLWRSLEAANTQVVIVNSGRDGHRHLFATNLGCHLPAWKTFARNLGLDVREDNSLIRPPGATHRNGTAPTLEHPYTWSAAAEALTPTPTPHTTGPPPLHLETVTAAPPPPPPPDPAADYTDPGGDPAQPTPPLAGHGNRLPPKLTELIRYGDRTGKYRGDRSALTMAIANIAVAAGLTCEQLRNQLADPTNVGGAGYRARPATGTWNRDRWLNHTWNKAQTGRGRPNSPWRTRSEAVAALDKIVAHARQIQFSGRTAGTDQIVLEALCRIAQANGGPVGPIGVRRLSETAGVGRDTAARALLRLRDAGWVTLKHRGRDELAATWELHIPHNTTQPTGGPDNTNEPSGSETNSSCERRRNTTDKTAKLADDTSGQGPTGNREGVSNIDAIAQVALGHDAWTHGALGGGPAVTWAALAQTSATVTELARRTRRHPGTIRRHLARLQEAGVVRHTPGHGWEAVDASQHDLDGIAERFATTGRTAARKARHRREQALFQQRNRRQRPQVSATAAVTARNCPPHRPQRNRRPNMAGAARAQAPIQPRAPD